MVTTLCLQWPRQHMQALFFGCFWYYICKHAFFYGFSHLFEVCVCMPHMFYDKTDSPGWHRIPSILSTTNSNNLYTQVLGTNIMHVLTFSFPLIFCFATCHISHESVMLWQMHALLGHGKPKCEIEKSWKKQNTEDSSAQ